jgi:hypothetical protein
MIERSSRPEPDRPNPCPPDLPPRSLTCTVRRSPCEEFHSRHPLFPLLSVLTKTDPRSRGRLIRASRVSERVNPERTKRCPGRNGTKRILRPSRTKRTLAGKKKAFRWKCAKRKLPKKKFTETNERKGHQTHPKKGSLAHHPK